MAARKLSAQKAINSIEGYDSIVSELSDLIESARRVSARSVNAVVTATYWEIGRRIVESEQRGKKRAGYGEALLERLAAIGRRTKFCRQCLQNRSPFLKAPLRPVRLRRHRLQNSLLND